MKKQIVALATLIAVVTTSISTQVYASPNTNDNEMATSCGNVERNTPNGHSTLEDTENTPTYITPYDEKQARNYGIINGEEVYLEGIYGIRLSVSGDTLACIPYTHKSKKYLPGTIKFGKEVHKKHGTPEIENGATVTENAEIDKEYDISLKGLDDGVYGVICTFGPEKGPKGITVHGWVNIKDGEALPCRMSTLPPETVAKEEAEWQEFIKDADPKDYLDETVCTYPSEIPCNHHCREEIDKIADDRLKGHDDWTDEAKVLSFSLWIATNIAYDRWMAETGIDRYEDDLTIPDNFAIHNHVGVCWDFSNILIIMCRHAGIPATSIDLLKKNHEIVAVYVNDEWESIDLASTSLYECETEDPDPKNWKQVRTRFKDYYGVHTAGDSLDYFVWK